MTEAALREKVVAQARSWLGKNEADGTYREIIDVYNAQQPLPVGYKVTYTDAWCATFVSAVGVKLGLTGIILPECSCSRMIALYQKAGRWMENDAYVPATGDLIMYGWKDSDTGDYTGAPDHVGMVESCDGQMISVIEGNYADSVKRRSIAVNARYIRGFCLPDYTSEADAPSFPDVEAGAYYADAVAWAAANGIVAGFPDGKFHPDEHITRAQAVTMLCRLAQQLGVD